MFASALQPILKRLKAALKSTEMNALEVDSQQMTALHILCANPHVTGGAIRAYLQMAPEAAEQQSIPPFISLKLGHVKLYLSLINPYSPTMTFSAIK